MRITRHQLRRIVLEACVLSQDQPDPSMSMTDLDLEEPVDHFSAEVPVPEDYDAVRDFLAQNPDIVDMGISIVMNASGASCERSTAQGMIDHLQDMLSGHGEEEEFGIGYMTGREI
jgi:hypothetical protein